MQTRYIFIILILFLTSCQETTEVVAQNKDLLESQHKHLMTLCQKLPADLQSPEKPLQLTEPMRIKQRNDETLGLNGFLPAWKSPANTLVMQASYCQTGTWNYDDQTLFQDSLIPFVFKSIDTHLSPDMRIYSYRNDPGQLKGDIAFLKGLKYLVVHHQLAHRKPQVNTDNSYKPGLYHGQILLYNWKTLTLLGHQTLKVSNGKNISYNAERHVEIWREDEETEEEYLEKTVDLGDEPTRIKRALEQEMYEKSHDALETLLKVSETHP